MDFATVLANLRDLYRDVIFGNGWVAVGVIAATCAVVAIARLLRPVKL